MKDNRFIDLLNLYIDRQITAAETAELEAEIQNNPKRQAVYKQYCQIHSATKLVYESFRAGAAEQPSAPVTGQATIELFESRRRRTNWGYYAGGLAAAACLALVFIRNQPSAPAAAPVELATTRVQPAVVATVTPAPAAVAAVEAPARAAEAKPGLINLRNGATPDYSAMLAALREQDEAMAASERWQSARPRSLFDDNMFEAKVIPVTAPDQRTLRRQTEVTAFQFQR